MGICYAQSRCFCDTHNSSQSPVTPSLPDIILWFQNIYDMFNKCFITLYILQQLQIHVYQRGTSHNPPAPPYNFLQHLCSI